MSSSDFVGVPVATAHSFEDEPSSMVHEQIARLKFAEAQISMKDKCVLDFGCGTGYNSFYVAERQAPKRVVGIDLLESCISYARERYAAPEIEFFVQDCLVHRPELGTFDVVLSSEVLEHVPDQDRFLDVLARYLAPDGEAFITTPNRALFSLTQDRSFLNPTHVRELFFQELEDQLCRRFASVRLFSQVHRGGWHRAYVDYLSAHNLMQSLRPRYARGPISRRVFDLAATGVFHLLFREEAGVPHDVLMRRFTDFEFVEGFDPRAVWFAAVARQPVPQR